MATKDGEIFGYKHELTGLLANIMRQWMSPSFREALMGFSRSGCNETDARVIWELSHSAPRRPGSVAEDLALGAAALTKSMARLTSLGLIDVVPDPTDSRARLMSLSEEGRKVAAELFGLGDYMVDTITAGWSEEEIAQLTSLLARFTEASSRFKADLEKK